MTVGAVACGRLGYDATFSDSEVDAAVDTDLADASMYGAMVIFG